MNDDGGKYSPITKIGLASPFLSIHFLTLGEGRSSEGTKQQQKTLYIFIEVK